MSFGDTEQQRNTYYKTFVCFGNKGACDVKHVRNRRHAFSLSYGVLDVTQNTGIGYVCCCCCRCRDRTHCFSCFVDCGKRGEEKMKLGRTEMSPGGAECGQAKSFELLFPCKVYALDINMCKVFFLAKYFSSISCQNVTNSVSQVCWAVSLSIEWQRGGKLVEKGKSRVLAVTG